MTIKCRVFDAAGKQVAGTEREQDNPQAAFNCIRALRATYPEPAYIIEVSIRGVRVPEDEAALRSLAGDHNIRFIYG